jgi:hypothetical protein
VNSFLQGPPESEDAQAVRAALTAAGITVLTITMTPGWERGDLVVFLQRSLQQHEDAQRVLNSMVRVSEVEIDQQMESILRVRFGPGLRVVK